MTVFWKISSDASCSSFCPKVSGISTYSARPVTVGAVTNLPFEQIAQAFREETRGEGVVSQAGIIGLSTPIALVKFNIAKSS